MTSPILQSDVVLVVDDSADTLSMLSQVLDVAGLTVLIALDGEQGVNIAGKMTPDIILLDAIMPNMDGFETCRRLKQDPALSDIPVIFMTGLSETEDIVKGLEAGGVDYVTKPINAPELIARMKVHLSNARMTQSARVALDSAGQNIFTTSMDGKILWSTPQVTALFASANGDENWLQQSFKSTVVGFIQQALPPGRKFTLKAPDKEFQCKYMGQVKSNEYLFKLFEQNDGSDLELLRTSFSLTEREAEVLLWLARGKTNREIAQILEMSPRTVNKHLEQVFRKMGVENRTSATSASIRLLSESGRLV